MLSMGHSVPAPPLHLQPRVVGVGVAVPMPAGRSVLWVVVQLPHERRKLVAAAAALQHAICERILSVHNCSERRLGQKLEMR